jgi:hypothetical protein
LPGGSRGGINKEKMAPRGVLSATSIAASLRDVAFDQIQANPMIAARFGGDAAFKDPLTDLRCNANALVGDFNNQLLFAEFISTSTGAWGSGDRCVASMALSSRLPIIEISSCSQGAGTVCPADSRVETQLDAFFRARAAFPAAGRTGSGS